MKFVDRYTELRSLIYHNLTPLIGKSYYLFDCPFHSNIGDQLIWEGELAFLNNIQSRSMGYSSRDIVHLPQLDLNVTVLFHGGGNLGELYREHTEFLFKVLEAYPNNRIIVFPQTIFYSDSKLLQEDVSRLKEHKDFHFCVRDKRGFKQLSSAGLRDVYLLPDMAFCIPRDRFNLTRNFDIKGSLYLKRVDGELSSSAVTVNSDFVRDWPTFDKRIFDGVFIAKVLGTLARWRIPFFDRIWNWYADRVYRPDLINIGRDFIMSYEPITSTRLHAIILALLCGKNVTAIDNSYGKISEFIHTWLSDVDEVQLMNNL